MNCRAVLIWGSDHRQHVHTAVPMGTMSGKAPAQNEQPASGLNPVGADVGTGLPRATHSPRLKGPERGCRCKDRVGRLPWKPSCSPFLVLGVLTRRPDSTGHRRPGLPLAHTTCVQGISQAQRWMTGAQRNRESRGTMTLAMILSLPLI